HVLIAWARGGIGGAAGLAKTLAIEFSARVRAIEIDPDDPQLAERIAAELHASDRHVEIGYQRDERTTIAFVPSPLPEGSGAVLGAGSVVLVTGGARGITAHAAI